MGAIKHTMKRNYAFRCLEQHAGKGSRESVKRAHAVNKLG